MGRVAPGAALRMEVNTTPPSGEQQSNVRRRVPALAVGSTRVTRPRTAQPTAVRAAKMARGAEGLKKQAESRIAMAARAMETAATPEA